MSFYRSKTVKGIKPYLCDNCGQWIAKGTAHLHSVWYEPEVPGVMGSRSHLECHAARVEWLQAKDLDGWDCGHLVDEAQADKAVLAPLPEPVASRIRLTLAQKTARQWPPKAPPDISHAAALQMLGLLEEFQAFAAKGGRFAYPLGSLQRLDHTIAAARGETAHA